MPEFAIRAEGLSKRYVLGESRGGGDTLRDAMARRFSRLRSATQLERDHIWSLRDVSFEIGEGEVVGIVGRNGAGKSTLLKLLSRITEPTTGQAEIRGRVGSLLEVGTGFHPELTGRENIYLAGAIAGMPRAEIRRKFDDIAAFSQVERFLDTPVKRYSSGMYVRLAFSVAAHMDPEILLVDEVLAVGDAAFQRKCLSKLDNVAADGKTVLLVSHNLAIIRSLSRRAIWLDGGELRGDGAATTIVDAYLDTLENPSTSDLAQRAVGLPDDTVRLVQAEVERKGGGRLAVGTPAAFRFRVRGKPPRNAHLTFTIYNSMGVAVSSFSSAEVSPLDSPFEGQEITCVVSQLTLLPGRYRINVAVQVRGETLDHVEGALFFDVDEGLLGGRSVSGHSNYGSVAFEHRWVGGAPR